MHYAMFPEMKYQYSAYPPSGVSGVDWVQVQDAPPLNDEGFMDTRYRWSITKDKWVLPFDEEIFSDYRDSKIEVEVSYDNGTEEFRFMNNQRTRNALIGKMNYLPIKNDPLLAINFETLDGFKSMTGSDLQGAFQALSESEQVRFDAKEHVLALHGDTPYEDINDAFEDFDTYVTNNS